MPPGRGRTAAGAAVSVERFFQFSLLGLVASGYFAVAGSGYLDTPTIALTALGLVARALLICGVLHLEVPERTSTIASLAFTVFFGFDYLLLSHDLLQSTVHLVFFLAVTKILTSHSDRDYLYLAALAFLELLAAAILSINANFFVFLALYLLFAIATLTSGEIRRSMRKAAVTARPGRRRFYPRLAALAAFVSVGILTITAILFFVLPRTADAALSRLISHRILLPGFSNQVTLGEIGEIKNSSRPVMHVSIFAQDVPAGMKWRGGALSEFDGRRWSNPPASGRRLPVEDGQVVLIERPWPSRGVNFHVDLNAVETDALFFPGPPAILQMRPAAIYRTATDGYRLGQVPPPGFRYDAYSLLEQPPETAPPVYPAPVLPLASRERYLQLPRLDPRIPELARRMTVSSMTGLERSRAIERHLRRDYGYTLELLSHEVPDPLAYFLFTRRKGHCEYFASSMTVMLRTLGIPARLVNGFQSGVWNPISGLWVIRSSDAHSWVEAWLPGCGWATFDPTPPDPNPPSFGLLSRLALYADAAETFWREWVVGYDLGRQGSLADKMEQGARRFGGRWFDRAGGVEIHWKDGAISLLNAYGVRVLIAAGLALWIWLLGPPLLRLIRMRQGVWRVRSGRASVADATLLYERMLQVLDRRGYQKPGWFTPREFAASLQDAPVGPLVGEFTADYNAVRFGGRTDAAPRLPILLEALERQER